MIDLPVIAKGLIGAINLKSKQIVTNPKNSIHFSCNITGRCCKRNQIPISELEMRRITKHGYLDFVTDLPPIQTPDGLTYWMKRINGTCVFLKDNKCSIHTIKPFSCSLFPFQVVLTSESEWDVSVSETNICDNIIETSQANSINNEILHSILKLVESYVNELKAFKSS